MPRKRLPFTGAYNTRPNTQTLSGSSAIVDVAVVDVMVVDMGGESNPADTRFVNCFQITVADKIAGTKRVYVVNRPGFVAHSTPAAGSIGNAIKVWTGQGVGTKVMSCFGATNSTLYDGTTSKGAITGLARGITPTSVSSTPTLVIASDDETGWYYQDGGSVTEITDAQFPTDTVGNFAALDGYVFIMDALGRVHNSDENSVTAWTANNYFATNAVPDVGVGVVRHRDTLVAFGKEHMEVLYNAGNPTNSPLSRIDERTKEVGLVSASAITKVRDALFFCGANDGKLAIYHYDGGEVESVSSGEINSKLSLVGPSNISLTTTSAYGRMFVLVNTGGATTLAYCVEEGAWSEWGGDVYLWHASDAVVTGDSIVSYAISKTSTSGKVYVVDPLSLTYADDGTTFTSSIQTGVWDNGTAADKFCSKTALIGDQGTSVSLSWSDDDYGTYNTPRTISLNSRKPFTTRCGRFSRRSFLIEHTADEPLRLEALELTWEDGSH